MGRGWLWVLAGVVACGGADKDTGGESASDGGGDGGGAEIDPTTVPLNGACPLDARWGGFTIDSNPDYAAVAGAVADGVVPIEVLTELLTEGECTIWRRENPFCDPGCGPGETCALDGTCVPYPTNQDIGVVRLDGLSAPVEMSPVQPGSTYFSTDLDNPPWPSGGLVALASEGGAYAPATLFGVGPEPLVPETLTWELSPGSPFTVRWAPPPAGARTHVALRLRVDQHGITPSSLVCTFADDGEGVVPAAVFDQLVAFGLTGFPAGELRRETVDQFPVGDGGCMDFTVASTQLADEVRIEGYTPCNRDEECPDGQTCNVPLQRCE